MDGREAVPLADYPAGGALIVAITAEAEGLSPCALCMEGGLIRRRRTSRRGREAVEPHTGASKRTATAGNNCGGCKQFCTQFQ